MADVECTPDASVNFEAIGPERPSSPRDPGSVRYLKICSGNPGPRVGAKTELGIVPPVPMLRLQGQWLERVGFEIGQTVRVQVDPRRLVIEVE
jgi:hypothetical protein